MKIEFGWETIDPQTLRARVAGGWLVRFHSHTGAVAMSLVPDPKHAWKAVVPKDQVVEAGARLNKLELDLNDPYLDDGIKSEMREEISHLHRFIAQHP